MNQFEPMKTVCRPYKKQGDGQVDGRIRRALPACGPVKGRRREKIQKEKKRKANSLIRAKENRTRSTIKKQYLGRKEKDQRKKRGVV